MLREFFRTLKPGGKRLIFTELMDKYFPNVKGYSNPVQNATESN